MLGSRLVISTPFQNDKPGISKVTDLIQFAVRHGL